MTDDWGARLASRVVDEVSVLAGGRLRPESAALLTDVTVRGYELFVESLHSDEAAADPERMAGLVGDLFADVDISLEDAMALHRHLEQVLLREVTEGAPRELAGSDPGVLESVARRFFNDLAAALADGYLAVRRGRDGSGDGSGEDVLECVLAVPPRLGEARRVARAADVDLDAPWQVSIVAARVGPLRRTINAQIRQALFGTVVLTTPSSHGLVVAVQQGPTTGEWPDLGQDVLRGVGATHADVRGLRDSHDEALEALQLARRKGQPVVRFEDAWFDRFLLGAVTADELADLVLEPIAHLTPHRREAVLETLEAFLDSGSSVGAVADALHLHRQSVNYRMQNIRRLFGARLMSPNGRLALHIAVMDAKDWQEAGLYDPAAPNAADRLALLEYLASQGCDLEEMVEAESRDRLFGLAGDRIFRPSRPRYDAEAAAAKLGVDAATVSRAWRAFGLPAPVEPVLGEQDLEALRTWLLVRDLLGVDAATALARVLGSGTARLAEATSSVMRGDPHNPMDRGLSGSEALTARAYAEASALVPAIGNVLDAVHRHHLEAARRHFELVAPSSDSVRCGVGFADLSGFTEMAQAKPMRELSMFLSEFEAEATDTVQDHNGRVVKFLGDAVMFIAPTAETLAAIACALVTHPEAEAVGLKVRAGVAYGDMLAQDGDYFGPPVNLASRLVAVAAPGEILASPSVVPLLGPAYDAIEREPETLRGIAEPVTPYLLVAR